MPTQSLRARLRRLRGPRLRLRSQLLLVSLLLLSLPWAGCQFIREIEGALRQGQEQSLQATSEAIATVMQDRPDLLYPNPERGRPVIDRRTSLYASPARERVIMDGYADGWEESPYHRFTGGSEAAPLSVAYQALTRGGRLYLLLQVRDPEVIYHNPGLSPQPNGDRLVLRTWQGDERQEYVIATAAPGRVRAQFGGPRRRGVDPARLHGYWQDAADGYSLELEMPLSFTGGRLGFYIASVGARAGAPVITAGNTGPLDAGAPPWLIYSPEPLQQALAPFRDHGRRLLVVDRYGWIVGDPRPGASAAVATDARTFWLLRLLYRSILEREVPPDTSGNIPWGKLRGEELERALAGQAATRWYRESAATRQSQLSAAAPILADGQVVGAVVSRESSEEYLSLTDRAFSRLLSYSLLALGVAALGLLGYASLLSWRIHRLSQAAERAVADDGRVLEHFPHSRAGDEIGDLSRRYADLLSQVREYNDYLRTLSRKLSHELRTPIAVIQGSLDNLEQAHQPGPERDVYLQRARTGLLRLNRILTAMSEANRLEDSIRGNPLEELDLAPLVREVGEAYRGLYPEHRLRLQVGTAAAPVLASADLLVQALDKLVDNAASFSPAGSEILVELGDTGRELELSVSNPGSTLPPGLGGRLFEPMVSVRATESTDVHLGLGLHVVRLIADYLGGGVRAADLPDGTGVRFTLSLPRACRPGPGN